MEHHFFLAGLVPEPPNKCIGPLYFLKMQIVQSSVILCFTLWNTVWKFLWTHALPNLWINSIFQILLPFIFIGGSESVGSKMRAFQIMLMKLNDCNLPYCEEKLLAVKDEDRIKILPWLTFDLKTPKISLGSYLWKPFSQPDEISFKRFYSYHGYFLALIELSCNPYLIIWGEVAKKKPTN